MKKMYICDSPPHTPHLSLILLPYLGLNLDSLLFFVFFSFHPSTFHVIFITFQFSFFYFAISFSLSLKLFKIKVEGGRIEWKKNVCMTLSPHPLYLIPLWCLVLGVLSYFLCSFHSTFHLKIDFFTFFIFIFYFADSFCFSFETF